jgi:hypothetical protein
MRLGDAKQTSYLRSQGYAATPGLRCYAADGGRGGSTSLPPRRRQRFLQGQTAIAAADAKEQPQGRGWQHPSAGGRQQRRRRGGATAGAARGSAKSAAAVGSCLRLSSRGSSFHARKERFVSCGMNKRFVWNCWRRQGPVFQCLSCSLSLYRCTGPGTLWHSESLIHSGSFNGSLP